MTAALPGFADLFPEGDGADKGSLFDRYTIPPFSVLDARQGYWQERKKAWMRLGIESELGREDGGAGLCYGAFDSDKFKLATSARANNAATASIFDPVLCELAYRWFSRPGARVLDPFAGGSVRGIVAGLLGMDYTGIELRGAQVDANRVQARTICPDALVRWIEGASQNIVAGLPCDPFDVLFSCPPYGDLEVYSDHVDDLSAMSAGDFAATYRRIIKASCDRLAWNRFAVFVVGDYRGKDGMMSDFVGQTIHAFQDAGLGLYNQAVFLTPVASAALRVGKQMEVSRKLGKTHQDVLVFVKGCPRKATAWLGDVSAGEVPRRADDWGGLF